MAKKTKRKSRLEPLATDVHSMVRRLARGEPSMHPELWARWGAIVGPQLYQRCVPLSLQHGRLVVGVSSSSWLHELSFLVPALLDRFAEEIGPGVVREIRLVTRPQVFPRKAKPAPKAVATFKGPLPPQITQILEGITDEELKESVEKAYRANLNTDKSDEIFKK